ncbi:MAG: hypothetical protein U9R01_03950 [candidate division WOR-3 bacterium]|nr:hypothetical protein [candidate division WOR-3 bacterium]
MVKRNRGVIRKEKVIVDGEEIELDTFDAKVILGSGKELESIEELLKEEEIEKEIQNALRKIEAIAERYPDREKDIWYCYEVGKVLQFVDNKGFSDRRRLIWQRMAFDLRPDLFNRTKKDAKESKRYPEFMYHLGKQSKKNVGRATFNQWREIVKFKEINKDQDKEFLEQILTICEREGLSRQRIKKLRESKYSFSGEGDSR